MPGAPWPNLQEVPREQGYRGARYDTEEEPSYYKGGSEQALQMGADGVGVLKTRSCMSLEPHEGSWEARLPAHAILSYLRSVVDRSDDPQPARSR